jgi:hypothetical protein
MQTSLRGIAEKSALRKEHRFQNLINKQIQFSLFSAGQSAQASSSEEPCAAIPHAGVCEGAVG